MRQALDPEDVLPRSMKDEVLPAAPALGAPGFAAPAAREYGCPGALEREGRRGAVPGADGPVVAAERARPAYRLMAEPAAVEWGATIVRTAGVGAMVRTLDELEPARIAPPTRVGVLTRETVREMEVLCGICVRTDCCTVLRPVEP